MSNSNGNGKLPVKPHAMTPMPPLEQVLRKRTLLLTGATGFLGKVFLSLLLQCHPEIERVYLLIRGDKKSCLAIRAEGGGEGASFGDAMRQGLSNGFAACCFPKIHGLISIACSQARSPVGAKSDCCIDPAMVRWR